MDSWTPAPTKIIGIGTNYRLHAEEMGRAIPRVPKVFLMPPSSVIGTGEAIVLPPCSTRVDHEAELALVIGERCRHVPESRALDVIAGFTCANDVTARDHQRSDGVFSRAKGFDSFCPLGPQLVSGLDPSDVLVECRVNGELRQSGRTSDLIFGVPEIVAFVSSIMTLEPGDVICTGTPSGVGPLHVGDHVEVFVEGIGVLENPVIRASR
ncbi:MAG: fumarylacetoacetate hydrolase family protein [Myxococcota bacterium]|nr:fumarylacetoacetate hydrolase family protein [Myxococcota bacterium]